MRRLQLIYNRHNEKLWFLLVGGWNTLFSLIALWVIDGLIPYDSQSILQKQLVLVVSWVVSVTQNFFTFKLIVFRTKGNWLQEYIRTYVVYVAMFVVQSVLMQLISHVFNLSVFWANLPTIPIVTVMSHVGHKYFTFREPQSVFHAEGG